MGGSGQLTLETWCSVDLVDNCIRPFCSIFLILGVTPGLSMVVVSDRSMFGDMADSYRVVWAHWAVIGQGASSETCYVSVGICQSNSSLTAHSFSLPNRSGPHFSERGIFSSLFEWRLKWQRGAASIFGTWWIVIAQAGFVSLNIACWHMQLINVPFHSPHPHSCICRPLWWSLLCFARFKSIKPIDPPLKIPKAWKEGWQAMNNCWAQPTVPVIFCTSLMVLGWCIFLKASCLSGLALIFLTKLIANEFSQSYFEQILWGIYLQLNRASSLERYVV